MVRHDAYMRQAHTFPVLSICTTAFYSVRVQSVYLQHAPRPSYIGLLYIAEPNLHIQAY